MASDAARRRALRRGPGFWGFWLAHHHTHELDRCYQIWLGSKPLWLCARCLGLIPALLLSMGLQVLWPLSLGVWDVVLLGLLPLPALVDWAQARLDLHAGGNRLRSFTGLALGLSMGRSAVIHAHQPFHSWVLIQWGGLAGVWVAIEAWVRVSGRKDQA